MRDSFSCCAKSALVFLMLFGLDKADAETQDIRNIVSPFAEILVGSVFFAQGNEPAWTLSFSKSRLLFFTELGRRQQTWLLPLKVTEDGAQRFFSNDNGAILTIKGLICRDTMSGMPYPAEVTFGAEGNSWKGCGGNPLALLSGKTWRIIAMNDKALQDSTTILLTIRRSRDVSGSTGCFRFRSTLVANGEGIRFKLINTTWPRCIPAKMHQARQFITRLSNVRRFDMGDNGTLLLFGDDQSILKALPLPTGG